MDEQKINSGHIGVRSYLRVAGPVVVLIGLVFIAIGFISFFSAFGSFGPPRFFWCAFIGMPLLFVGMVLTKVAYFGAVARYMAAETAPVGKDVFNYMARETQTGVRDITAAVKDGLSGGETICTRCQASNDRDATFCDQCGSSLVAKRTCPYCAADNDTQARFCNGCGKTLTTA